MVYAVGSMGYLECFLYVRLSFLWANRHLPSVSSYPSAKPREADVHKYLGPSALQMAHLFLLTLLNTLTLFLVSITMVRSFYALALNTTTIESWEIERHRQLLRRARVLGCYLDGPDGKRIRMVKQDFPYDIGIWQNFKQGMGTGNFLSWLWPLASTPKGQGLDFEVNDFEEPGTTWPPPDPDRMPRLNRMTESEAAFTHHHGDLSPEEEIQAFRARQAEDFARRQGPNGVIRRRAFRHRYEADGKPVEAPAATHLYQSGSESGEEGWKDYDGNRLADFGLDEEVEFYDEDEIPLGELMRRRGMNDDGVKVS